MAISAVSFSLQAAATPRLANSRVRRGTCGKRRSLRMREQLLPSRKPTTRARAMTDGPWTCTACTALKPSQQWTAGKRPQAVRLIALHVRSASVVICVGTQELAILYGKLCRAALCICCERDAVSIQFAAPVVWKGQGDVSSWKERCVMSFSCIF